VKKEKEKKNWKNGNNEIKARYDIPKPKNADCKKKGLSLSKPFYSKSVFQNQKKICTKRSSILTKKRAIT